MSVLECSGVSKRFGGVQALSGVRFAVEPGQVFAVIGPNGAGKTTLMNVLTGLIRADQGTVTLEGRPISTRVASKNVRRGMARTLQAPVVFPGLTVRGNIMLGHAAVAPLGVVPAMLGLPSVRRWERDAREKADELLELLALTDLADRSASELSLGQQRLVEIGRALANEPKIILLDEPAAGLAAGEVDRLAELLTSTAAKGIAICLVEHNMRLIMDIADRILVVHHGQPLFEGTPAQVQRNPDVIAAYLGKRGVDDDSAGD